MIVRYARTIWFYGLRHDWDRFRLGERILVRLENWLVDQRARGV